MFDEFYIEEGYVEQGYFQTIVNAEAILETVASKMVVAGVIGDFFVPMDLNAAVTAEPTLIKSLSADLASEFASESTVNFIADSQSNLNAKSIVVLSRWNDTGRPRTIFNISGSPQIDTTV